MTTPFVSVIIPCYNSYKDIGKCLDALENQTYRDFEVIIVDDFSKDDSLSCLKEYAEKSKLNIKIIANKENRGPGFSRNAGIKAAKGEMLSFCDADDWYPYDRLEKMISVLEEDVDCVLCNLKKVYLNGSEKTVDYVSKISDVNDRNDIVAKAAMSFDLCLIRTNIAERFPIAELYNGEDYATFPLWLQYSRKIKFVEDALYSYYMRSGSLSRKPSPMAYLNFKKAFSYMRERSLDEYRDAVEYLGVYNILYGGVLSALKAGVNKKNIRAYIDNFSKEYPRWNQNRYLGSLSRFKKTFLKMVKCKNVLALQLMAFIHKTVIKLR